MQTHHGSWFLHSFERVDCLQLSVRMKPTSIGVTGPEKRLHLTLTLTLPWPCSLPPMMPQTTSQTRRFHTEHPQWPTLVPGLDHLLGSLFLFKDVSTDMKIQNVLIPRSRPSPEGKKPLVEEGQTLPSRGTPGDLYSKHPHLI